MLRESHSPTHKPKAIRLPKPPSQEDVMWGGYMKEVLGNAFGDVIHPDELSPANTNKYEGVNTHPVIRYDKDTSYPHLPLPTNAIPKDLRFTDWKNRK